MRSIWMSIRSAVTILVVATLCVFVLWFVRVGLLEAKEGLRVIETVAILVLSYYFALKKRPNGEEAPPEAPERPNLPPPVERVR